MTSEVATTASTLTKGIKWAKEVIGKDNACLIANGDLTEGIHHRNEAEIIAAQKKVHVDMAIECLLPLAKLCKQVFVVKGTSVHTDEMESDIAKALFAVDLVAKDKWLIRINNCLCDIAHHMSTSSRAYLEASAMSIQMGNARLNYLRAGHEVPQVFCRAHRHAGGYYSDGQGLFAVTGAYQLLTRHGFKCVTDSIPRPSILILDWRGKALGELPQVHEKYFVPEQDPIHETDFHHLRNR